MRRVKQSTLVSGLVATCVLIAACNQSPTQVIVFVDAEDALRDDIDRLRIRVQGRDGKDDKSTVDKLDETLTGKIKWPVKLALAPAGGNADRIFRVEAIALDGGTVLATARLLSGYIRGQTRYARLVIEEACRSVDCPSRDDTCHDGQCVDAYREPGELGRSEKNATDIKPPKGGFPGGDEDGGASGIASDGGNVDGASQTDVDAGVDASLPMSCTTNADCETGRNICSLGKCVECTVDTECADAKRPFCDSAGSCRGCATNPECPSGVCEATGECGVTSRVVYLTPGSSGSEMDCGTQNNPCGFFPTAFALLSAARPVLVITKGTYTQQQFEFGAGPAIRVIGDGVILNLLGGSQGPGITVKGGANVTIEGLTVRGASDGGSAAPGTGITCDSSTLTLQRVSLLNNSARGVSAVACTFSLFDSLVDNNGDYGVQLSNGQAVIERSVISGNLRGGIGTFSPNPMRIANNLIVGNSSTSNYDGAIRSSGAMGTSTVIAFNTITGNFVNQNFIGIVACAPDFIVDSNIVWGNTVEPSSTGPGMPDKSNLYQTFMNCTVTNSITELAATEGSSSTFSNMITSDPRFINPMAGGAPGYGLMAESPALDIGNASYAGSLDQARKPRISSNGPDLGCYER